MNGRWLTPDAPAAGYICKLLRIPNSEEHLAIVNGALLPLLYSNSFELFGTQTAEETAALFEEMYEQYIQSRGCMIGAIIAYATADAPLDTLACDGATYDRVDFPLLYDALDSAFIVDADTFTVPDLQGRAIIGTGGGTSLTARAMGDSAGTEQHTLSVTEIPGHTHGEGIAVPTLINGGLEAPASSATSSTGTTGSTGGDGPHNNMMPYQALRYCIVAR